MNEDTFEIPEGAEYRYLVEVEVQYVRRRNYVSPLLVLSNGWIKLIGLAVVSALGLSTFLFWPLWPGVSQTMPRNLARVTTDVGAFEGRHVSLFSCC